MQELIAAIHLYSIYSGGDNRHAQLLNLALQAGMDLLITADQNVLVQGFDGYAQQDNKTCLLLAGEEIFARHPCSSSTRLLVLDAGRDMAPFASQPQQVIKLTAESGGLSIMTQPMPRKRSRSGPPQLPADMPRGFSGMELWNSMNELQSRSKNRLLAHFFTWLPRLGRSGPDPELCKLWDQLHAAGQQITAIAGSGLGSPQQYTKTPARLKNYLLHNITNHLLVPRPLGGDLESDRRMVFEALRQGHTFIACDDLAPGQGFRFHAQGRDQNAGIGDELLLRDSVTFQVRLPQPAKCLLFRDGELIHTWHNKDVCVHSTNQPGSYRVEAHLPYLGQETTWIISNPIRVRPYVPSPLSAQLYTA